MPHDPFHSDRWVRGLVGNTTVVECREQLLVWEHELPVPRYLFPTGSVEKGVLVEVEPPARLGYHHPNSPVSTWFDIVVGDQTLRHAAWIRTEFPDHVGVTWQADHLDWFEEARQVFEHPHDPYVHIDAYPSTRHVTISIEGVGLADTSDAVFLWETGLPTRLYVPRDDVDLTALTPTDTQSVCPYKGFATDYWSTTDVRDVAWSYPDPFFPYRNIADRIAFLSERVDVTIDGVLQPRPVPKTWAARERLD